MSNRVRVSIGADKQDLAIVGGAVAQFAARRGLAEDESRTLLASVEGTCSWLIDHAYPDNALGEVTVQLELASGAVRVVIEDWGEPLRAFGGGIGPVPEALANVTLGAHDLRLVNLGRDGKRTSFAVPAEAVEPTPLASFGEVKREADSALHTADELVVRASTPDDADEIGRLLFSNYGLGYGHPEFYLPRWVAWQIETGSLDSSVALIADEIVGHHALMVSEGERMGETGVAVVHPGYRGLGILGKMQQRTLGRANDRSLDGVFARAVTTHPYSQRAELKRGYRETALLLGSVPVGPNAESKLRGASLITVLPLGDPSREVTLPERYSEWLAAIFERNGMNAAQPVGTPNESAEWPSVRIAEDEHRSTTTITVHSFEGHGREQLLSAIRGSIHRHDDLTICDLDLRLLSSDELDAAIELLRSHDFFFSGLMPFGFGGHDRLRMQALLTDDVLFDGIVLESDFAKELRGWVI
jgi:anti-sigma regulatory factor (Ser/Thr protein kinase)/N-acetylglutamate synthase-like GNAT family acetyltransferase